MTKSNPKPKSKTLCRAVGGLLFVAAVASVFLIDWEKEVVEEPPVVRPIATMVVGKSIHQVGIPFPGKVSGGRQIDLAFEVPGSIDRKLVIKGDEVKKGQLLMGLDPRDFKNDLKSAEAELARAETQYERMKEAFKTQAVAGQDVDNAKATFEQAQALVDTQKKALEDTDLRASFDGMIGDVFVKQFQAVQAKQSILSLVSLDNVEIDFSVPAGRVALAKPENRDRLQFKVIFDYFPDDEPYSAERKEFATQADPVTQTFQATVTMPRPERAQQGEGRNILPGMAATVLVYPPEDAFGKDGDEFLVPLDAVPPDDVPTAREKAFFVWKLKPTGSGTFTVHRTPVEVGEFLENEAVITNGLDKGDRIAVAGVTILTEGREVRLLDGDAETEGAPADNS